jgi:hypothetical protein
MKKYTYVILVVLILGIMGMGCVPTESSDKRLIRIEMKQNAIMSEIGNLGDRLEGLSNKQNERDWQLMNMMREVHSLYGKLKDDSSSGKVQIKIEFTATDKMSGGTATFDNANDAIEFIKNIK